MDSNFRIQFINGLLSEHDFPLPLGLFALGEGGDVWVKFQTQDHLLSKLSISEKGVSIDLWDNLWIDGIPAPYWQKQNAHSGTILPLDLPIELDGVGFVLLPKGESLSEPKRFTLPAKRSIESLQQEQTQTKAFSFNWKEWLLGPAWAGLLMALAWGSWKAYTIYYPPIKEDVMGETTQWIQQQQKLDAFLSLAFSIQPNGEISVSGACWDSKDLNRLYAELRARGWLVRSSVVCNDELTKAVEYTLRLFGFDNASVTNGEQLGSVRIAGSIKGDGTWQQVEDLLIKVPGLKSWTVSNDVQQQASQLMELLSEQRFSNSLDFSQKNGKILITGRLNRDEESRLRALFDKVRAQFPNNEFIYQNIDAVSPDLNIWPSPVIAIGGNRKTPFVELGNGLRLQLGSKLPSGYQIIGIDAAQGIRLMMQGKVINVPIDFNV